MKREEGLALTRRYRRALIARGLPVRRVLLYGSVARGEATEDSDLDVAVVCAPFRPTRLDENLELWRARREVDARIEPVCLHADDFDHPLSLAREIERTGVEV